MSIRTPVLFVISFALEELEYPDYSKFKTHVRIMLRRWSKPMEDLQASRQDDGYDHPSVNISERKV